MACGMTFAVLMLVAWMSAGLRRTGSGSVTSRMGLGLNRTFASGFLFGGAILERYLTKGTTQMQNSGTLRYFDIAANAAERRIREVESKPNGKEAGGLRFWIVLQICYHK